MTTSVMSGGRKDLSLAEAKHPLNSGYGGGRSMSARSDHGIRNIHDYAHLTVPLIKWILINNETIAPTRRAARKKPILQSRRHTAHVLIKRITTNRINSN
jgi:hypothetical protein